MSFAFAAARKEPPDVMLMDIGLPDMDGCEALRRLREELGRAPVAVALTGLSGEDEHARIPRPALSAVWSSRRT